MSTPPRTVAVLIPFYHAERLDWLEAAVRSVTDQQSDTPHKLRVYLGIDGPLHPGITEFLQRHEQELYKVVHNPVNQGLAVILNRMIDALEEEDYVARLDADDLALPGRFTLQVDFMETHPDIHVCGGAILETDMQPGGYRQTITYPLTHEEIAQSWFKRNPIAHPATCIRRTVFREGHRYPVQYRYNQDLAMWISLLGQQIRFGNLPETLIAFRIGETFYKRRGYEMAKSELVLYLSGIRSLRYPLYTVLFPITRFLFRLTPAWIKNVAIDQDYERCLYEIDGKLNQVTPINI